MHVIEKATDLPRAIRKLGLPTTLTLARSHLAEYRARLVRGGRRPDRRTLISVRPKGYGAPIWFRLNTTDINVLQQVFLSGEYECAGDEPAPRLIVDCGANIGCASVYFLTRYPGARVVSIEADAGACDVCRRNLAPFGPRAELIHGAIWPRAEELVVDRGCDGDRAEWSFSVRPRHEGESKEIDAVLLADLVARSSEGRIDLLKIDIEGAEEQLFASDCAPWLARTRSIVIEVHGLSCRQAFLQAIEPFHFRVREAGPVLIAHQEID
ncbi:MAG: FkbM family methyltransferase [Isosphaeraceae bacterium]